MARFSGVIGYGETVETPPDSGVHVNVITERKAYGEVRRNTRQSRSGETLNNDISVRNEISVVADAYATENFLAILYVSWLGKLWTVTDVEVESPRLILQLGEVYRGETPA